MDLNYYVVLVDQIYNNYDNILTKPSQIYGLFNSYEMAEIEKNRFIDALYELNIIDCHIEIISSDELCLLNDIEIKSFYNLTLN